MPGSRKDAGSEMPDEQTLEGESKYFNEKFPAINNWLAVIVREATLGSGEKGNARRFEVVVTHPENSETFVCYYDEGDLERRSRTEGLLGKIYPAFSGDSK